MRKGVLFLIFAMIFTMFVPAQALTMPQSKLPEMPVINDINGSYVVSVKSGDDWNEIGSLNFGKNPSTETIDVGSYLIGDNPFIKLSQDEGGSAYLDAVLLNGKPATEANGNEGKLLNKLSKEDLDITPVGEEGVVLEFSNYDKNSVLAVTGRIEDVVISEEPLQFPAENNYKSKDDVEDFYSYTLGSNVGAVIVDGILDEVIRNKPFVREYRVPGSGHPAGDTFFWVMNDEENLYVSIDVTPDNTFDGDKDYAKVYVNTNEGIEEFKISVPETKWGNTGFTYTDNVVYEHKVYEFAIPLSEVVTDTKDISIAFVVYGTVAMPIEYKTPDIAYDSENDVYVCVYEGIHPYADSASYIWADIVSSDGTKIGQPRLISYQNDEMFTPSIAYDNINKTFLVVWSQDSSNSKVYGKSFKISKIDENIYLDFVSDDFRISGNEDVSGSNYVYYNEFEPEVAFNRNYEEGNYNGSFLIVWSQWVNDSSNTLSAKGDDIYGRFVYSDGTLVGDTCFAICNDVGDQYEPSLSYSFRSELFMLSWINEDTEEIFSVNAKVINQNGSLGKSINPIIGEVKNPNISINESNDFFLLTWVQNNQIKGVYCYYNYNYNNIMFLDTFTLSSSMYENEYPVSVFGKDNMLSLWNALQIDSVNSYAKLSYWDIYEPIDEVFETEYPELTEYDNWDNSIDVASNFLNDETDYEKFIIVYVNKGGNAISYRAIGETPPPFFEPKISFENDPYTVEAGGDSVQATVKYSDIFNYETNITDEVLYEFDSNYLNIDSEGYIYGINPTPSTTIRAYYYPIQYYLLDYSDELPDMPEVYYTAETEVTVTANNEPGEKYLEFDKLPYNVQVGSTKQAYVNYFDGYKDNNVTDVALYVSGNSDIATIVTGGAITGITAGPTTISAIYYDGETEFTIIADVNVYKPSSGSSSPTRTPIGEILVNNKVIKTLFIEDVINKNNAYTFTADKSGESARLWLDSEFYEDMAEDYPNRIIKFNWDKGTYTLPLNCDEVFKEIDSSAKKINILIEKVDEKEIIEAAKNSAEIMGAEVTSDLIDFSVFIEKSNSNTDIESLDFYAVRTINQLDEINENISTAMKFVEDKETLTFAPSVFDDDYATVKYRGNGIFTVIENPQTFNDISNHWAKVSIEKLATRNIAFGKENNNFAPNDFVTRAEFAVMITRALGITEEEGANSFTDVANEWYAEDINTAFSSGLINGRNDGKFYPNEKIQRKDMAVIIQNALKFTGITFDISNADSILSIFKDKVVIADYAREATAICTDAGIILGRETKNFDPDDNATRAEATAIIERMLRYLEFMD